VGLPGMSVTTAAWADYDNDGDLDVLLGGWLEQQRFFTIYRNEELDGLFVPAVHLPTELFPSVAAWGDFDNDGDLDLAVASSYDWVPATRIYRNDGQDAFTELPVQLPALFGAQLSWSDYDNDGDLDLVLTGNEYGYPQIPAPMTIARNGGAGRFTKVQTGLPRIGTATLDWGDYDNDGDLDILAVSADLSSSAEAAMSAIYRNDGGGAFRDIGAKLQPVTDGGATWGDYDNDGDLDVLLTGNGHAVAPVGRWVGPIASVYRNDHGEFVDIGAGFEGAYYSAGVWGDVDNDGDLDALIVGSTLNDLTSARLYLNEGRDHFVVSDASLVGARPATLACGDFDADGDADFMISGWSNGAYAAAVFRRDCEVGNVPPEPPTGLDSPSWAGPVQLTWRPSLDIETPSAGLGYNLRVSSHPGGADIIAPMALSESGSLTLPQRGRIGAQAMARLDLNLAPGTYYWSVHAVDTGFAGSRFAKESTFSTCAVTLAQERATVAETAGTGEVSVTAAPECRWRAQSLDPSWLRIVSGHGGSGDGVVVYSVDANSGELRSGALQVGDKRFVVVQGSPCAYTLTPDRMVFDKIGGNGTILVETAAGCGWSARSSDPEWLRVTSISLNGAVLIRVDRNVGKARTGTLTIAGVTVTIEQKPAQFEPTSLELPNSSGAAIAWLDLDSDGDLDLIECAYIVDNMQTRVFRNDGAGSLVLVSTNIPDLSWFAIAAVDYDGDGDLDLLMTGWMGSVRATTLLRNGGNFAFTEATTALPGFGNGAVAWGDFDNDGDPDLLLAGDSGGFWPDSLVVGAKVYSNEGRNVFRDVDANLTGVTNAVAACADFDADGDLDIALAGLDAAHKPTTSLYKNLGAFRFAKLASQLPGLNNAALAWGDYDNDGDLDLVAAGTSSIYYQSTEPATTTIYRNEGDGSFVPLPAMLRGSAGGSVAWGDYDADGDLDLLVAGGATTTIYRNDGGGSFVDLDEQLTPLRRGTAHWDDFDDDGDLDFLLMGSTKDYGSLGEIYRNSCQSPNTPPRPPAMLAAGFGGDRVTLAWSGASDAQTPSAGLGYAVRVATKPGGADVVPPMAVAPTGERLLPGLGNAGSRTWMTLGSLRPGTYYWSVQAIDTALASSPFAAESSFEYRSCGSSIAPSSATVAAHGGQGTITVTIDAGCGWVAASSAPTWLAIASGASGTGNGVVSYSVAANPGPLRSGVLAVAGQLFTVTQVPTYAGTSRRRLGARQ
jgi:hypothetical protein